MHVFLNVAQFMTTVRFFAESNYSNETNMNHVGGH